MRGWGWDPGFWKNGDNLRARNLGEGDAVAERRCWGESRVQVLGSEGEFGGEVERHLKDRRIGES